MMAHRLRARRPHLLASTALLLALASAAGAGAAILPQGPSVAGSSGGPGATFNYGGPNVLTVNQSAARVVIDWQSFSIGAGGTVNFSQASPSWIAFNRVTDNPMTGLSPLSTIAGNLNATGGVWLFSTGGILFGPSAVVNVGSFAGVTGPLATAGGLAQLLNPGIGGFTSVGVGPPIGQGVEAITVQNGAQITANSGFVVLQAETMTQDGAITAFDGVDYTISESGRIVFTTSAGGQQLQSADALVVAGQDRPSFTHGGSTTAAWVGIDTPGGALQAGYHGVINLDGEIQASGVKPGSGGNGVVFLIGGDAGPAYPGYTGSSIGLDASGATIHAAGGMLVTTDSAKLGPTVVGGPLTVNTYGDNDVTAPTSAGGAADLTSAAGVVNLDADLTADGSITASATTISVAPGVTVQSDALGQGAGGIILSSAGSVTADATSQLIGGVATSPNDGVTVRVGSGPQGGDIVLGGVSATRVYVQSQSRGSASEGGITLAGNVVGTQGVTVLVNDVADAGSPAGQLQVLGNVTSAGFVDLEDLGPAGAVVGPGARVASTTSQVFLYSGGATTVDGGAQVSGVSLLDHTLGTLTVATGATIATTGVPPAPIAPVIPYGSDFVRASGLNLAAANMNIAGAVTAGPASAPGDIYIEVLGPAGATAVIGGSGGSPGFNLTNASFSNLSGRDVVIMGGPGEATGPGASLTIDDLTLSSAKLSALWLGTSSSQSITIAGAVTPTGPGKVDVNLGFVRLGQGGAYQGGAVVNPGAGGLDGFVPGEIDVTGSLGSATSPLGATTLIARNDIFMGVPAFVTAARADPNFNAVTASANYPGFAPDHVFVATSTLQLAAQGRIVEQNTPGNDFVFAGLDIGAPTPAAPLIFVPPALQNQPIAGGVWTADYALGPSGIVLFGALTTPGGGAVDGAAAATTPDLLDPQIGTRPSYLINSCTFGSPCASATPSIVFVPPEIIEASNDIAAAAAQGASSGTQAVSATVAVANVISALTSTAISLQQDDERLGSANPITETGNGDLSSQSQAQCPPGPDGRKDCVQP